MSTIAVSNQLWDYLSPRGFVLEIVNKDNDKGFSRYPLFTEESGWITLSHPMLPGVAVDVYSRTGKIADLTEGNRSALIYATATEYTTPAGVRHEYPRSYVVAEGCPSSELVRGVVVPILRLYFKQVQLFADEYFFIAESSEDRGLAWELEDGEAVMRIPMEFFE